MLGNISRYHKAVVAFVTSLGGIWVVVAAADFSSREGAWSSLVAVATAIFTYAVPNKPTYL
jgi:hypothetical protein